LTRSRTESGRGRFGAPPFQSYAGVRNPHRIAGPFVDLNFGLVEIDWNSDPSPLITLRVVGIDGASAFEYWISLDGLKVDGDTA
jgi:hypothetical protein